MNDSDKNDVQQILEGFLAELKKAGIVTEEGHDALLASFDKRNRNSLAGSWIGVVTIDCIETIGNKLAAQAKNINNHYNSQSDLIGLAIFLCDTGCLAESAMPVEGKKLSRCLRSYDVGSAIPSEAEPLLSKMDKALDDAIETVVGKKSAVDEPAAQTNVEKLARRSQGSFDKNDPAQFLIG